MSSDQTLNENISALVQPRIHSSDKSVLENAIPLQTPFSTHIDVFVYVTLNAAFVFKQILLERNKKVFLMVS